MTTKTFKPLKAGATSKLKPEPGQLILADKSQKITPADIFDELQIRPQSKIAYKQAIRDFERWAKPDWNWRIKDEELLARTLKDYRDHLADQGDRLKPATKNLYLSAAKTLLQNIYARKLIPVEAHKLHGSPVKQFQVNNYRTEPVDDEWLRTLLDFLSQKEDLETIRAKTIIMMLAFLGLRSVEIRRLLVVDVLFERNQLMVLGKGRDDKEPVECPAQLMEMIRRYLSVADHARLKTPYLFYRTKSGGDFDGWHKPSQQSISRKQADLGGQLGRSGFSVLISRYCERAGIIDTATGNPLTAHKFRAWFATTSYERNKDIKKTMDLTRHRTPAGLLPYINSLDRKAAAAEVHQAISDKLKPKQSSE